LAESKTESIAVFCICGLGDVICTLPGLIGLTREFPEAQVFVVVNERPVSEFFSILDHNFEVIDLSGWSKRHFIKKCKLLNRLRKQEFSIIVSRAQPNTYKVPLLLWFTKAKQKIGGANEKLRFFYDELVSIDAKGTHSIDRFLKLASHLTKTNLEFESWENLQLRFRPGKELASCEDLKGLHNEKRTVVIGPGGDSKTHDHWSPLLKRWPVHHYRELVELLRSNNINVLIVGNIGDVQAASVIASGLKHADGVYNLCGKTSLSDLIVLLQSLDAVVVGHDSGLLHLAAMLSRTVIGLFGPTSPNLFGPRRGNSVHFIWAKKHCRGCFPEPKCNENECEAMKSITSEQVLDLILSFGDN
jgi:lipopolysaccharide heptosyltransferase II